MRVRKSSWHYRLAYTIFEFREKPDLCRHFWTVALSCFLLTLITLASFTLVIIMTYPIWQFIFGTNKHMIVANTILWIVCGTTVLAIYHDYRTSWRYDASKWYHRPLLSFLPDREPSKREPSIVAEYVRAKKQKICPFIEYVDE